MPLIVISLVTTYCIFMDTIFAALPIQTEVPEGLSASTEDCAVGLMPTASTEIVDKGMASLAMLNNLGLQDIQTRLLPAGMMYRHYIDNTKMDISLLKL